MENAAFKECQFCKEQIRNEAIKCRFCGEWLEERCKPKLELKQEHGNKTPPPPSQSNQEPIGESVGVAASTTTDELSPSEPPAVQVAATDGAPYKPQIWQNPLVPLFIIVLWIFARVVPQAIENGTSGVLGIVLGTLSYCTTPESLLLLILLGIWFWTVRRTKHSSTPQSNLSTKSTSVQFALGFCLLIVLAYTRIHSALELARAKAQLQTSSIPGFNPNALDGWEVLKGEQRPGDASTGLTPAAKKRMREMVALQLKGNLAPITNLSVDLQGAEHDKLAFSFTNVNPTIATNLPHLLQEADKDFWNRMRFLNFKEVVFAGADYHESFPESKFSQWSHGYDTFISNIVAMYNGTSGQRQLFHGDRGELNPTLQKTMRQSLASTLNGGLKSFYNSIEVRLEGEAEDRLVVHLPEMDAAKAAGLLLKVFRQDKTGNFWNGLRALAFSEFVLSGDNYHRSIPRKDFIQWCHDYEEYLSELHKVAGQVSGAVKHETKAP